MHQAETMTTLASFDEITPPDPLAGDHGVMTDHALAGHRQWLCSAEIRYDPATLSEHCSLRVCDVETGRWTPAFEETRSFDTASPEEIRNASAGVRCRTRVVCAPDTGREGFYVRFDSPMGARLLRIPETGQPQQITAAMRAFDCEQTARFDGQLVGYSGRDGHEQIVWISPDGTTTGSLELPGGPASGGRFLSGLTTHEDSLYLTLTNKERGFEVWKMTGTRDRHDWTLVLERGAYRYAQNQEVLAAFAHRGDIILIAGASPDQRSPESKFFDYQGFEVIRLSADGTYELLAGVPRFSPQGLLVPLSGRGPNIARDPRLEFVCGAEHAGHMVIGVSDDDGFRLWVSADGETWQSITTEAFRTIYRVLGCRMLSHGNRLTLVMDTREVSGQARTRILTSALDAESLARPG